MRSLILLAVLAGCGDNLQGPLEWGVGVTTFDAAALGLGVDRPGPTVTPTPHLALPTYEHSGQVVHPDVLREPDRFVLAYTPYPYSNGKFENPSVTIGTDGVAFVEPKPGENPLAPTPPVDHNDDPDLHIDPVTGEYVLLYLETERPMVQRLVALRSRDLVAWTRSDAITYDLAAGAPFVVSPAALVHDGATTLFDVHTGAPHFIERLDEPWDPARATPIAIDMHGITPWHVDVLATPAGYAMLINGFTDDFTHQSLYLATSADLATWTLRAEPLLAYDELGVATLYRSTGLVIGDQLVVWYSMQYQP